MRKLLTSTLFQYSTKVQTFKKTALDRIVEKIIYSEKRNSLTTNFIQSVFREEFGYTLPISIFESSISRLLEKNRINNQLLEGEDYILSKEAQNDLDIIQQSSDRDFIRIIDKLFANAQGSKKQFHEPFWFAICYTFSNLGEYSAKLIEGKIEKDAYFRPILDKCILKVKERYTIDHEYFIKRITFFFEETTERLYSEFKWKMAQSYFITNSLGINPTSEIFSKEIFDNSILYLDTNILLTIVSKNNKYYNNANSFINAAKKINLKFCISKITIDEYEKWVNGEADRIIKTRKQIPCATNSKIGSCIFQDLILTNNSQNSTGEFKIEVLNEIVRDYLDIKNHLSKIIPSEQLEYIDDTWFNDIEGSEILEKTIDVVIEKYRTIGVRLKKGEKAAIHDAKMLLWINREISKHKKNIWFVTADSSLPLIKVNEEDKSNSILLEVILQWLVPLTNEKNINEFQDTFSEILKNKLLPREILFEVNDFIIFEELHMECAELPAQDVEECILFIKKNAPNLNPNDPNDRETLANKIAVYFADPGRKYKLELNEKENENIELRKQLGDVFSKLESLQEANLKKDEIIEEIRIKHEKEISNINTEHKEQIEGFNNKLNILSDQLNKIEQDEINKSLFNKFQKWERLAIYSSILFGLLLFYVIFELLPCWSWNYPCKILDYMNEIQSINKAKYDLFIGINIALITIIISLAIFIYKRLLDSTNRERKRKELLDIIMKYSKKT